MITPRQQSGLMLLEVLIGLLLFVIGILGVIGLQAVSLKNTVDAKYRMEATYLANQIIGQMWADAANIANYTIAPSSQCPDPATTAKERWLCDVATQLPGATGVNSPTITVAGTVVTIVISWRKDAAESVHNHTVVTDISIN